jgi:hypothetical protein
MNQGVVTAAERFPALALAPNLRASIPQDPGQGFDANRDRILITLLALDLMLMAFFVVLNSAATFDTKRSAAVASSMPTAVSAPAPAAPEVKAASLADTPGVGTSPRAAAAAELDAAVSDVFANYLPAGTSATADADNGRVDVDMPAEYVREDALPPAVIAGLAHVMENSPPGYRTELVIRTQDELGNGLAQLAQGLVGRGVDAAALSVGILTGGAAPGMHFTFLLLEPGEQSRAARLVGRDRP